MYKSIILGLFLPTKAQLTHGKISLTHGLSGSVLLLYPTLQCKVCKFIIPYFLLKYRYFPQEDVKISNRQPQNDHHLRGPETLLCSPWKSIHLASVPCTHASWCNFLLSWEYSLPTFHDLMLIDRCDHLCKCFFKYNAFEDSLRTHINVIFLLYRCRQMPLTCTSSGGEARSCPELRNKWLLNRRIMSCLEEEVSGSQWELGSQRPRSSYRWNSFLSDWRRLILPICAAGVAVSRI